MTIAPQPPPPAASRKPPIKPERRDDLRPALGVAMHDAAIEEIEAERGQISEHERLGRVGGDLRSAHRRRARRRSRPGMTIRKNSRQSTLRCATWLIAETAVVNVSARVDAGRGELAGGTPMLISKVLEIWPKAMPSAPSTSCAAKPIRMNGMQCRRVGEYRRKDIRLHPVEAVAICPTRGRPASVQRPRLARAALAFARDPHLDCGSSQARGDRRLQSGLDRLSGLRQIPRSGGAFALGRAVLSRRLGAGPAPRRALAVGGAALFPRAAGQSFRAFPDRRSTSIPARRSASASSSITASA